MCVSVWNDDYFVAGHQKGDHDGSSGDPGARNHEADVLPVRKVKRPSGVRFHTIGLELARVVVRGSSSSQGH